jgi:hypothetical protein
VDVEAISRSELRANPDRGGDFKLGMRLNEWAFAEARFRAARQR